MLNRSQLITLFGLSKRNDNPHCRWPKDIRKLIAEISSATFDPQSDIARLLHHIAYGNLVAAELMLEANPRLVLQAGHTETPSGLKVLHTTPLECALGAGDPEMAKMIEAYFDSKQIKGGAEVREQQYARYRPHIKNLLSQKPYDFTLLIETLIAATPKDVTAALNRNTHHGSVLRDVLVQFRIDFTPGSITSGMHFNYQHLLRAYEVYIQSYDALSKSDDDRLGKLRLYSRHVIGFIQRSLPAIDRMVFAQSLYVVVEKQAQIMRSFKFKYENLYFPDNKTGYSSLSELGFEYCADGRRIGRGDFLDGVPLAFGRLRFGKHISSKNRSLAELMQPHREEKACRCVIC